MSDTPEVPATAPAAAAAAAAGAPAPAPKVDKKAERIAARLAEEQAKQRARAEAAAAYAHLFGERVIKSFAYDSIKYTDISALKPEHVGATVTVRARIASNRKQGAKLAFLVLRQAFDTIQAIVATSDTVPPEFVAFAAAIPTESIVDVEARVAAPQRPITSTSQQNLELEVVKLFVVSESLATLPFQVADASRSEANNPQNLPVVNVDTRLGTRWLDMRTPASNAIFRMQSRVGQYFRQFLIDKDFVEIHSPKMIGTASEGGSAVFKLDYMGRPGYLAQSPQLYKQMALQGDLERVFEVGPVFRAENSFTHRHLTEFVGLDIEMRINEHYFEVLDVAEDLFDYMFSKLVTHTRELTAINEQYPFEPFAWQVTPEKMRELGVGDLTAKRASTDTYAARVRSAEQRMLRMPFASAIALLNTVLEAPLAPTDDINTENEKKLGKLVKDRYGVDFYIVDRFPLCLRPFYTMPCPDDELFSNSYDMFMRGEEISSGAQRVHIADLLERRASGMGVNMAQLKDYVDAMRLGAWPHGGFGVGLERVTMLYFGLRNIRACSMFPRDPNRLTP